MAIVWKSSAAPRARTLQRTFSIRRLVVVVPFAALAITAVPVAAQSPPPDGQRLFATRCASCHSREAGQNRIGPHLASILGRKAGAVEGARYSPGLKASGIVWSASTLDAYLANPRQTAPGTTMTLNVSNPAERAAIINYLGDRR